MAFRPLRVYLITAVARALRGAPSRRKYTRKFLEERTVDSHALSTSKSARVLGILGACLLSGAAAQAGAAEAIASGDPYAEAGLFESVEIHPWNWVFNAPEPK